MEQTLWNKRYGMSNGTVFVVVANHLRRRKVESYYERESSRARVVTKEGCHEQKLTRTRPRGCLETKL